MNEGRIVVHGSVQSHKIEGGNEKINKDRRELERQVLIQDEEKPFIKFLDQAGQRVDDI